MPTRKLYIGAKGGKYYKKNGKRVYVKSEGSKFGAPPRRPRGSSFHSVPSDSDDDDSSDDDNYSERQITQPRRPNTDTRRIPILLLRFHQMLQE